MSSSWEEQIHVAPPPSKLASLQAAMPKILLWGGACRRMRTGPVVSGPTPCSKADASRPILVLFVFALFVAQREDDNRDHLLGRQDHALQDPRQNILRLIDLVGDCATKSVALLACREQWGPCWKNSWS